MVPQNYQKLETVTLTEKPIDIIDDNDDVEHPAQPKTGKPHKAKRSLFPDKVGVSVIVPIIRKYTHNVFEREQL